MKSQDILKISALALLFLNILHRSIAKPLDNDDLESDNEISEDEDDLSVEDKENRIHYARKMLTYMNQSVDPCEDFYEYACGNWKNLLEERSTTLKRNNMYEISYKIEARMDRILRQSSLDINPDYKSEFEIAQKFYKSCLEADLMKPIDSADYLAEIKKIGGFPAVDSDWNANEFSWFNMSAHLTNYGIDNLIREEIYPLHPFRPYFKIPELGFGFNVHSDNIEKNTSTGYIFNAKRMRKYLTGYGVQEPKLSETIEGVFDFFRAYVKLSEEFEDDLNVCVGMAQMLGVAEFKQWKNYVELSWNGRDFGMKKEHYPCHFYYVELDKICENHKAAVANYLAMSFLYEMDSMLTDRKFQQDYCINQAVKTAPYLMDELYLEQYFTTSIRDEVVAILKEVRKSLQNVLREADFLDEDTRNEALEKERTLTYRVGKFEDKDLTLKLIRSMTNLELFEDNFERNNINAHKYQAFLKRFLGLHSEQFDNSTKPLDLLMGSTVNAGYYNLDNSINVLAGILQPPAYHKSWPNSLKFGTLGFLIGHEFTHGFDSTGARFDSTGSFRYWWSPKSGQEFDERARCFGMHYGSYYIPEINRRLNGIETQDENIADSGGMREALHAYRAFIKETAREQGEKFRHKNELMPAIDLSAEQLFFLGFAQLWCSAYKEEHYWDELSKEHAIDKYRVLGTLTNFKEFAKVFNCPLGSEMNPEGGKCRVW